jgi:outer membrane receptor protein involved in Fe transport
VREYQYDAEVSHRLDWMDGAQHTVYGGSFRYNGIESAQLFSGHPYQKNAVQRGFASQAWQALPRLNLIGALSLERSDTGGVEPAYQFAAVANPWDNHTLRASYGLAPTIPTLYTKAARQQASPTVLLVGNPGVTPQRLRSYEVSYQGLLRDKRMLVETNLFYMKVDQLGRTIVQSYNFPLLTLSFDNENSAVARGAELKWSYRWNAGRSIYANYTYETISDAKAVVNVSKGTPPHKVNLGGTAGVGRGFSLGVNSGFQDGHTLYSRTTNLTLDIPAYWRVDAKLAYRPKPDWELFLACQNLARARHVEFADGLTVPRTYQAGVSVRLAR